MKCYQCNVEIPEGSVFCPHCGKRIEVPESLKCPQCNLDVPEGTEYCPNCGSHIGTPKSAICSKCGTEIPKGGVFCPNCGNPSHIENGHQGYDFSGLKEAKDKYVSKAEELIQQSKKYINEKVQPKLDERVQEFKSVDWEEKKKESFNSLKGFFSNKDKLHKATIWIAVISVLWFFIINDGFSASWMWLVMAIMVVCAAFCKAKTINDARKLFAATLFFCVLFVFYSPEGDSRSNDIPSNSYNSSYTPSWIQGEWICRTPYGLFGVKISGNQIYEVFPDGSMYYGKYHIDGDYIIPETGSHTHLKMDRIREKLSAGYGYYYSKK